MITVYITVFRCRFWGLRCLLSGLILCFLTFLLGPICSSTNRSTWRSRWLRVLPSVRWPTIVTGLRDLRCTLGAEGKTLGCARICGRRGSVVAGGRGPRHRKVIGVRTSCARWSFSGGRNSDLLLSLRHRALGALWSLWERTLDALESVEIDVCRSAGWTGGSGWRSHFTKPVFESRRIPIPCLRARARQLPRSFIYRHSAWWYIVGRCSSTQSKYEVPCTSKWDVVG